jgi:hypothetical protein
MARRADFLDAVFYMAYYNRHVKPLKEVTDIKPEEVFSSFSSGEYLDALGRSQKLLDESAHVGMAYHDYPDALSYDDAQIKMKADNPGFDDACYDIAVNISIQMMR